MILLFLFLSGCAGALVKDILKDGYLMLPRLSDNKLYVGFIGSILVGGAVGVVVDHSPITAFLAGYVGFAVIEGLVNKQFPLISGKKKDNHSL